LNCTAKSPFDRIEAAQQYLALLSKSVADNRQRVEADMMEATNHNSQRFLEVLRLGVYNLEQLEKHLKASRQMLNNLRKLRRLLSKENPANPTIKHKSVDLPVIETPAGR